MFTRAMSYGSALCERRANCMPNICSLCNKADAAKLCGNCKKTYYCSRKCQKRHWWKHRSECYGTIQLQNAFSTTLVDVQVLRIATLWTLRDTVKEALAIGPASELKLLVDNRLLSKNDRLYQIFDKKVPIQYVVQQSSTDSLPELIDSSSD